MCASAPVTVDCDHWAGRVCHRCPVLRAPLTRQTRNPESGHRPGRVTRAPGSRQQPDHRPSHQTEESIALFAEGRIGRFIVFILLLGDEGRRAKESGCQSQNNGLVLNC